MGIWSSTLSSQVIIIRSLYSVYNLNKSPVLPSMILGTSSPSSLVICICSLVGCKEILETNVEEEKKNVGLLSVLSFRI